MTGPEDKQVQHAENPTRPEYRIDPPRRRMSGGSAFIVSAMVIGGLALVAWPYLTGEETISIETSETEEFQEADDDRGFGDMDLGETEPQRDEEPEIVVTQPEPFDGGALQAQLDAQRRTIEAQNEDLASEVTRLREQLSDLAGREPDDNSAELARALQDIQRQNADLIESLRSDFENRIEQSELQDRQREADAASARQAAEQQAATLRQQLNSVSQSIESLRRENQALEEQFQSGLDAALTEQQERDRQAELEAQRRAELEARRAEAEEARQARIESEGVIFDAGGRTGGTSPGGDEAGSGNSADGAPRVPSRDDLERDFVSAAPEPVQTAAAEVIANPGNTVLQGTIIPATMETAISSDIPGPVSAVVTYPVWSFDQSQVVIPQGSRLFGSYSSDLALGQSRILIRWSRIVTPDGQSVQMASFGADDQGRSGVTGDVNRRFGLRFGSAALLSIVGAGPTLAAAQSDTEVGAEVAEDIADDFSRVTQSVAGKYARIPQEISIQPGASITVIVDRDLEFF